MQTQMDADSPVQWHIWNYSAVLLFGVFAVNAVKALAAWCWSVSHGETSLPHSQVFKDDWYPNNDLEG